MISIGNWFGRWGGGSPGDGVTITVKATYEVRSPQRIQLIFQEAGIGDLRISGGLEGLLAPALLPRTWLQQRLLLALREVPASPAPPSVFPFALIAPLAIGLACSCRMVFLPCSCHIVFLCMTAFPFPLLLALLRGSLRGSCTKEILLLFPPPLPGFVGHNILSTKGLF